MSFLDKLFGLLMPNHKKHKAAVVEAVTVTAVKKVETRVCKKTGLGVEIIARGNMESCGYATTAMVAFKKGDRVLMAPELAFDKFYLTHHEYARFSAGKANPPGKLDARGWIVAGVMAESYRAAKNYAKRQAVRWNEREEKDLLSAWRNGATVKKLAALHERSEGGVSSRLLALGVFK